ncbi:MAG: hypothetical protein CTY15_12365, partial [Methylocystis sp.]
DAAFHAGAGLALFDQLLRSGEDGAEPVFAGVLRRRLALQAAAHCARLARLREDEAGFRDAAHLAPEGAAASPAGRLHRLFRQFGERPLRSDRETLFGVAEQLGLRVEAGTLTRLVGALQDPAPKASSPLAAAASMSCAAMVALAEAAPLDADIFALWHADLALAQRLGWTAPVPLIATRIDHPALRTGPNGQRPRPNDPEWPETIARATALACQNATVLGADLSRRAERLMQAAPKLRAKGAARVVDLLLSDDCVTPTRAAKHSGLSDRAARRLFDRLIELGAVRELSGRANFRLYGL